MKTQQIKKLFTSLPAAIFFIACIVFSNGCRKEPIATDSSTIVYTDVNPDSVILQLAPALYKLDMNNDGIADFEFDRSRIVLCNDYETGSIGYAANFQLKPLNVSNAVITNGSGLASALDSSKGIAPDSLWATTSQILVYGPTSLRGHCPYFMKGNWINVLDKYVGLKFIKNNQTYYGWARLSSSFHRALPPARPLLVSGQLILKDYAFNSIANQPILAGQTK